MSPSEASLAGPPRPQEPPAVGVHARYLSVPPSYLFPFLTKDTSGIG